MADEPRSFSTSTVEANRARNQGLGVGQRELNLQHDPDRSLHATEADRPEAFHADFQAGARGGDRPQSEAPADRGPVLGEGVPRNVDAHDLGDADRPQLDWGDPAGEAMFSSNHTRRGVKTEAERGQGPKTRRRTKDIINRKP